VIGAPLEKEEDEIENKMIWERRKCKRK